MQFRAFAVASVLLLGFVALVAHTRALTASHHDLVALLDGPAPVLGGLGKAARVLHCQPDTATGLVGTPHAELWGDVVRSGAAHPAASAAACCEACASTRGCNVYVWCAAPAVCGAQCWLKRVGDPAGVSAHAAGESVPWQSGALAKDADVAPGTLPVPDEGVTHVVLGTRHGGLRLRLRPEWSAPSVAFVRLLARHDLCTPACEFYRVEPGFLLQGSLRALIPANDVTTEGPRHMVRGDVGWAGGSAGPDFFIYLGAQPATHWGLTHTVWAEVADAESLALADTLAALPPLPTKPGEMHIIATRVPIEPRVG